MSQTQIIQVLKDLKKDLPVDVWKFKELFKETTGCGFEYDSAVEPDRRIKLSNGEILVYTETFNEACNETVRLRDVIIVEDYGLNNLILVHYDL